LLGGGGGGGNNNNNNDDGGGGGGGGGDDDDMEFKEIGVRMWTELIWLRIGFTGGLL
jgi:hypothetical protein